MTEEANILGRIVADVKAALDARMAKKPFEQIEKEALSAPPPRDFFGVLQQAKSAARIGLIAEIKKASPSAGLIRADFDPVDIALEYTKAGATCLSVLTEPNFFQGDAGYLREARAVCPLPVLRKDFMIHPWQIAESRAMGADCVLLIMACLENSAAQRMAELAARYGMAVLIEVHDEDEMLRALRLKPPGQSLIGINNRNLKTLEINLATTEKLAALVPPGRLVVSESGIKSREDVQRLRDAGVSTFLIGETLMKQPHIAAATRELLG